MRCGLGKGSGVISQILRPCLEKHFPNVIESASEGPLLLGNSRLVARCPAVSSEFGDVEIYDDGDEVTIFLGDFTHIHIGCYEEQLSPAEKEEMIVQQTMDFLSRLFADKIECWKQWWGGGCGPRGSRSGFVFVWSGRVASNENPGSLE